MEERGGGGAKVYWKVFFVFSQNSFESGCDHVVVFTQQLLTKYTHYIQHAVRELFTLSNTFVIPVRFSFLGLSREKVSDTE